MTSSFGFRARKAGQAAAFFVMREGALLNVVKLVKLIYLADREFMRVYDEPMLMDNFVSMRLGPVNSRTYECVSSGEIGWDEFISGKADHNVALAVPDLSQDALDELSEADIEVLEETWSKFGHMNQWQLVEYTHDNCPEWEDPGNSSSPIPYGRIFKFLDKQDPTELQNGLLEYRQIDKVLNRLK